jgi:hypothetical protein
VKPKALCKAKRIDRTTRLYVTACGGLVKQRINARHPMTVAQRWRDVTCKDCLVLKPEIVDVFPEGTLSGNMPTLPKVIVGVEGCMGREIDVHRTSAESNRMSS